MASFSFCLEKQLNSQRCYQEAGQVGNQSGGDGVAGLFDTGGAEIDADGIKCSFCRAQHYRCCSADERIWAVLRHQICAYRKGCAAA